MDKEKNITPESAAETGNDKKEEKKAQDQAAKDQAKADKKAAKEQKKAEKKAAKAEKPQATFAPSAIIAELKKVQWPSFKQLVRSSGLVVLFTFIFGLYFFVCELAASALVSWVVSI